MVIMYMSVHKKQLFTDLQNSIFYRQDRTLCDPGGMVAKGNQAKSQIPFIGYNISQININIRKIRTF